MSTSAAAAMFRPRACARCRTCLFLFFFFLFVGFLSAASEVQALHNSYVGVRGLHSENHTNVKISLFFFLGESKLKCNWVSDPGTAPCERCARIRVECVLPALTTRAPRRVKAT